jgi:uncharacterized membrane protein
MIHIEASIDIDRPPSEVFDFLADLENTPKWQSGVIQSKVIGEGPIGKGTMFEERVRILFWKSDAVCEIVEFQRPTRVSLRSLNWGPGGYQGSFQIEGLKGGCRLSVAADAWLNGAWKLLQPLFAADAGKETRKELAQIKANVEGTHCQAVSPLWAYSGAGKFSRQSETGAPGSAGPCLKLPLLRRTEQ